MRLSGGSRDHTTYSFTGCAVGDIAPPRVVFKGGEIINVSIKEGL